MTMIRAHFADYEPFHYWISGFRHNTVGDLDADDPDDAEALREAFERCVQDIAGSVPDHYGYTFAYELAEFEWPDDIRDAVMTLVFGDDWRNQ